MEEKAGKLEEKAGKLEEKTGKLEEQVRSLGHPEDYDSLSIGPAKPPRNSLFFPGSTSGLVERVLEWLKGNSSPPQFTKYPWSILDG